MHSKRMRAGLTAIIAAAGTAVFTVLGTAGAASAAPKTAAASGSCVVTVQNKTSGAFSNDQDILGPGVVPSSVSVVATQGASGNNPPVDTFGPGTGYTVSADWSTVTLQTPYTGSKVEHQPLRALSHKLGVGIWRWFHAGGMAACIPVGPC
jgi:hypothetical protein